MSDNPFNVLNQEENQTFGKELTLDSENPDTVAQIQAIIGSDQIVLFMKGNAHFPECGFSANTIRILDTFAKNYTTFNILRAPHIREGIKEFSNWPTFPQLYIGGKLIGGNDIITEMFQSGDLAPLMNN